MIEVFQNLYIGNQDDYEKQVSKMNGWSIVHACKEPYHRAALGYIGRGAPKGHSEYLIARRGKRLILNLVDAPNPIYIPKEIMDAAVSFIHDELIKGKKVLVHCNLGGSRSPIIGLLYLAALLDSPLGDTFAEAEQDFKRIYPPYAPAGGVHGYAKENFDEYKSLKLN
ncbi:MAG: dual specificity protein phosphatase family protein [Candidatus Electryonea clarkiae]|nr:dual specificity protein phosphatase family protein [Candidatus Electryonea clarkiae]MDP8289111.1 dual specificity protein phosphatase family protein [Candidatus Electryonea clarkiae]